jgi:hypothetical protein
MRAITVAMMLAAPAHAETLYYSERSVVTCPSPNGCVSRESTALAAPRGVAGGFRGVRAGGKKPEMPPQRPTALPEPP